MDIKLSWNNPNTGEDGTRIYRSESPMDPQALPTPLTTVGPGVSTYTDTTVQRYKTYYYRFETYKGDDAVLSGERVIDAMPYTGPGPSRLAYGDMWEGFFGIVRAGMEFWTAPELIDALDFNAVTTMDAMEYTSWFKFAWRNKIVFMPTGALGYNVSWDNIYRAGLVYGVNAEGTPSSNVTPTNQLREVTRGPDTFVVRLPTGNAGDPGNSEWDQLLGRTMNAVHEYQLKENWASYTDASSREGYGGGNGRYIWVQNLNPSDASASFRRGDMSAAGVTMLSTSVSLATNYSNNAVGWFPVLELKPKV